MEEMTFTQMMRLSIALPILLVLSVFIVAQALERLYAFWITLRLPAGLWEKMKDRLEGGGREEALSLCRRSSGIVSEALESLLNIPDPDTETLIEAFQVHRQRMHLALSRRVGLFGTVSFIAPLIGLMGTVLGIMRAFHDLAKAGAGGPAVVAAGISEALIATAAGIGVAVVSAVLYNYFTLTAKNRLGTLDLWMFELSQLIGRRPVPK